MRPAVLAAILGGVLLSGCSSFAPLPDPTPEHPRVGCRKVTTAQQSRVQGKLLPDPVRVIGSYEPDAYGREQWRVLLSGVVDPEKWVPMPKESISFVGCGASVDAFREVISAEQREPR